MTKLQPSGLGLDNIGDLMGLLQPTPEVSSGPLEIPLELIDEDPKQPRKDDNPGFSGESLEELAATIRLRGIKTPISVRENPAIEGRYIINHGARRFRGSKLAGKTTIPGFIDNDYLEADQVIENIQRDDLTAREIADFIGRELAKGKKKGAIAKEIGKSPSYITQYVTLLDLPDPIAEAFNKGRSRDVTLINDLVTLFKKNSDEVTTWLDDDSQEITRGSVKLLREFLDDKRTHEEGEDGDGPIDVPDDEEKGKNTDDGDDTPKKDKKSPDPHILKKTIVQVEFNERPARLILNRRPSSDGFAWLKFNDDGEEIEVDLVQVKLMAVMEG
jgi:ParB family chromosome partitioning protein